MKYGSYEVVHSNRSYAIGHNKKTSIQPYVTWKLIENDVTDAIFFDTYEDAFNEYFIKSIEEESWELNPLLELTS